MEEPESILQRIMRFEETYTPQFSNLIKQSLIATVGIDDGDDAEHDALQLPLPVAPRYPPMPQKSKSANAIISVNDHTHSVESLMGRNGFKPGNNPNNHNHNNRRHRHKETPIISRSSPNTTTIVDSSSFILPSDVQYNSDEDDDDDAPKSQEDDDSDKEEEDRFGSFANYDPYGGGDDSSDKEDDTDPLIEEYDKISHEIHVKKIRLRKLDRQIMVASRENKPQSDFVKQHSAIKITIGQLIHKRRELESHDIVRQHLKAEEVDTVEIEVGISDTLDLAEATGGLMEINEDEEEEDKEIVNSTTTISPKTHTDMALPDGSDSDEERYGSYERSGTTDSTNCLYDSYDADTAPHKDDDDDDDDIETGSVEFHSDGSVRYHSSQDEDDEDEEAGSVQLNESAEDEDDEEGGGSVQLHSSDDEATGSVHMNDEEDEDDEDGAGSVQMNDVDQTEEWVGEEFDTKSMEIHDSDPEHEQEEESKVIQDQDEDVENVSQNKESARSKRRKEMSRQRSYKEYGNAEDDKDVMELDALKDKYRTSRRNREQISEVDTPFSLDDLLKQDDSKGQGSLTESVLQQFEQANPEERGQERTQALLEKEQAQMEAVEQDIMMEHEFPQLRARKSVLLDINILSARLANIVEEDGSEDEAEGQFQVVEYASESDCDSNDSVVVKKEIVKEVSVDNLPDTT